MKRIVAHRKTVVVIVIGVTILLMFKLSSSNTWRKWSEWTAPVQDVTICRNGTRGCVSSNHEHFISRGAPNQETFPDNKGTPKAQYKRKRVNYKEKLTKARKAALSAAYRRDASNVSGKSMISNKDLFDSWRQGFLSDKFNSIAFEDINISEETGLNKLFSEPTAILDRAFDVPPTEGSLQASVNSKERSRTGRKISTRKGAIVKPIPPPLISRADIRYKPVTPHPSELDKVDITCNRPTTDVIVYSCLVGSFLGVTLFYLSTRLLGSIRSYVNICCRHPRNFTPLNGSEHSQILVDSDCNLALLPLDLKEILVKKLDVRFMRQRFYGWQKLGAVFKVPIDDLRYLKLEYKRDTGSPTSTLLEILGKTMGTTIYDLVMVLNGPEVKRPDITSLIKLT